MATSSTSTGLNSSPLGAGLSQIPPEFRKAILKNYEQLKRRYHAGDVNGAGTAATQFCEDGLRWIQEVVRGKCTPFGTHIANFGKECDDIERLPAGPFDDALRVLAPKVLKTLHAFRSKRGFVHTPGAVSANRIDLATMARLADWFVAELLRVHNQMDLAEAQALIDSLAYRDLPHLWRIGGKTRVLADGLNHSEATLVLLYERAGEPILAEDLFASVEYSRLDLYRRNVLRKLHEKRWIEYDEDAETATISPKGSAQVEDYILPRVRQGS